MAYSCGVDTIFTMYGGRRLSGMLLDPNAYGGLVALTLAICEGTSWGQTPLLRRGLLLYCRLNLVLGILFTFSRSAWISLFSAFLLLCAFRPSKGTQLGRSPLSLSRRLDRFLQADIRAIDDGWWVMIPEMLQGFFKKSFSIVNWPILRSRSAMRRASSIAGRPPPRCPMPGNAA